MIDYGLFMMIYKPSKLIYSSVHIDRVYHFIRDNFSKIPLYTYISFNGPIAPYSLQNPFPEGGYPADTRWISALRMDFP